MSMSCSGMSSTVSCSASSLSCVPFLVSWKEQKRLCLIVPLIKKVVWVFLLHPLCKFAYLQFESFQLLFPESVEEFFPAQKLLLHSKLSKRICTERTVALHHTQSASSSTGNTGEALAPRKEEHCHLVEGHIAPPRSLGFLKDGCCCGWRKYRFRIHLVQVGAL